MDLHPIKERPNGWMDSISAREFQDEEEEVCSI
jgi:hypothetical protein